MAEPLASSAAEPLIASRAEPLAATASLSRQETATRVLALRDGAVVEREDRLVREEPLGIKAAGPGQEPAAVAGSLRTPGHEAQLAVGFLRTEGLIVPEGVARG